MPALERFQMFFRKWLAQAEAVGSFLLTQSGCLAPGLILLGHGRVPVGVAAEGFPAPRVSLRSIQRWQH